MDGDKHLKELQVAAGGSWWGAVKRRLLREPSDIKVWKWGWGESLECRQLIVTPKTAPEWMEALCTSEKGISCLEHFAATCWTAGIRPQAQATQRMAIWDAVPGGLSRAAGRSSWALLPTGQGTVSRYVGSSCT